MGKGISKNAKKQIWNILFLVVLVGITLAILFTSNRELNFKNIGDFILRSNPWLLILAFLCMLAGIVCEGLSIRVIARKLGYKCKVISSMAYSSADIYYSALTPSASGGQPASAYYMVKDGIDAGGTTFILLFNLIAYTLAIFVVGALAFILRPGMFSQFEFFVKFLIIAGIIIQGALLGFFVACMFCHKAVLKVGNGLISLLARMKLVKKIEKWQGKLAEAVEKYRAGFEEIKKHKSVFFQALLLNVAQRVTKLFIDCFVCMAAGCGLSFVELVAMQAFVTLGYNSVPLPGGVGAYEYLYLRIYGLGLESAFILSAVMVSRVISYYLSIVVSGIFTLGYHVGILKKEKKKLTEEKINDEKFK